MTETLESAKTAASTLFLGHNGEWWDFALILSVVVAAAAATAIGITTAGSIISHKREASAAEMVFDKYKLDAELKLEQLRARMAPLHLTSEQQAALAKRMAAFPGTVFSMSTSGSENDFVMEMGRSLMAAGWKWANWSGGGMAIRLPQGLPEVGIDTMKGIETHIYDPFLQPVAIELFHALKDEGFDNQWIDFAERGNKPKSQIVIIVGSKK